MSWMVVQADARRIPLADASVHCVVTSPPYWGLRDYGVAGQIGLEPTPEAFVAGMVQVFREVRRVLRDDGTCWLNLGDTYSTDTKWGGSSTNKNEAEIGDAKRGHRWVSGLKPKDLIGIPWRVALALQADGWYLRSDVIWSKPNPMPESVTDRPTKAHEYIFLLAKSERYFYDAAAIAEPSVNPDGSAARYAYSFSGRPENSVICPGDKEGQRYAPKGKREFSGTRNRRTVWEIPTQSYAEAHFATYPEKLVEPCILAGTSERGCCASCGAPWERVIERTDTPDISAKGSRFDLGKTGARDNGDRTQAGERFVKRPIGWQPGCTCGAAVVPCVVFDPFNGSGTTGAVARKHGRRYVGLELNHEYIGMAVDRISRAERPSTARSTRKAADAPLFEGMPEVWR